jgi:hypothetical protein
LYSTGTGVSSCLASALLICILTGHWTYWRQCHGFLSLIPRYPQYHRLWYRHESLLYIWIKGIPNGFPCRIAWSMHVGKRKNTQAAGECIFTLSESRATSQVHGSRYPAWKTIW